MDNKKIKEILASEDRQIDVKAELELSRMNINTQDRQDMKKKIKQSLITENDERYPINEEKRSQELKEYTKTFSQELKKQQELKEIEKARTQQKIKKMTEAYRKQERFCEKRETKTEKKTLFQIIKEFWDKLGKKDIDDTKQGEIHLKTHKEFSEKLSCGIEKKLQEKKLQEKQQEEQTNRGSANEKFYR